MAGETASGAASGAAAGTAISPGLGTVIGAGIGAAGGLLSSIFGSRESKRALAYNKWVQQETWKREDSAVQRRAADLKAAGFSPLLAAGSAASTSAPQQVGAAAVPDLSGVGDPLLKKAQIDMQIRQQDANIAQTNAQTQLTEAQREGVMKQNQLTQKTIDWYDENPGFAPGVESGVHTGKGLNSIFSRVGNFIKGKFTGVHEDHIDKPNNAIQRFFDIPIYKRKGGNNG